MYPATYFGLFPAFPRNEVGFVAMSFDPRFDARWENVISKAISSIGVDDVRLTPHRVDLRNAGDSILTEILDNIARCRIFVADITAIIEIDGKAIRNANVMYEVGLAHAMRQPEEVILVRSDNLELGFDIANVRVHKYDADGDPKGAKHFLRDKILQSLSELNLKKNLAVGHAVATLDYPSWNALAHACAHGSLLHPPSNLGSLNLASAIEKLLYLGAIETEYVKPTVEILKDKTLGPERVVIYKPTKFGREILNRAMVEMGIHDQETQRIIEQHVADCSVTE